jgi:hypothetical protein
MSKKLFVNWAVRLSSVAAVALIAGNLGGHGTTTDSSTSNPYNNQQSFGKDSKNNPFSPPGSSNEQADPSNNNSSITNDRSDNQFTNPSTDQSSLWKGSGDASGDQSNMEGNPSDQQSNDNGGFFTSGNHRTHTRTRAS